MANKINPKKLPWFPFYTSAWLGSGTVLNMTMAERGIYITLIAYCWQNGNIPWNLKTLVRLLGIDRKTVGHFMDKYGSLTDFSTISTVTSTISTGNSTISTATSTDVTLPKLQEYAETLAKNAKQAPPSFTEKRREEKMRGDDMRADEQEPLALMLAQTIPLSSPVTEGKTKAQALNVYPPAESADIEPSNAARNDDADIKQLAPVSPVKPAPDSKPPKQIGDIRDWNEDRFGVSGYRLAHCIVYQLDYSKDEWYRKGGITLASMEKENFIIKLNAETPIGWTQENHGIRKSKPSNANKVETDDERETREYRERIRQLKQEGRV